MVEMVFQCEHQMTTNCYNCGSNSSSPYATENGFALVRCGNCNLLYVSNRPADNEISEAHRQGKHGGDKTFDITGHFEPAKIPHYLEVLRDLFDDDLVGEKTWLDIGCGHGEFLTAVQRYGRGKIVVSGTEPNERKQQSARAHGLEVTYFDLVSHARKYDVVSLLNVYSHLPDPPAFLAMLRGLLNHHGELLIETGNSAGFDARSHYRPFYLPDHLSFASQDIVVGILQRLGFEIVSIRTYPLLSLRPLRILKEIAKALIPGRQSQLRYYLAWKKYANVDMFIRARLVR
jgi:SAM-dependent methyltransferase